MTRLISTVRVGGRFNPPGKPLGRQPQPSLHLKSKFALVTARALDLAVAATGEVRLGILVSGFWRSGTTWLQECLAEAMGGKSIFEPLAPENSRWESVLLRAGLQEKNLRSAHIPGPKPPGDVLWRYLDDTLMGRGSRRFVLSCRRSVGDSLKRLVVAKDVRLQHNLSAVHARYGVPIVHLRRHPCAVVASLRAARWEWSFADLRLADLFSARCGNEDRSAERLAAERYDTDLLSRVTAYWALTEGAAARQLDGARWGRLQSYEAAVAQPFETVAALCRFAGQAQVRQPSPHLNSAMTDPERVGDAPTTRTHDWKRRLSGDEVARVRQIVDDLLPTHGYDI